MTDDPTLEQQIAAVRTQYHAEKRRYEDMLRCALGGQASRATAKQSVSNLRAAIETLRGCQWKPIKDAPSDGRDIILARFSVVDGKPLMVWIENGLLNGKEVMLNSGQFRLPATHFIESGR